MSDQSKQLLRERRTIKIMIEMYCRSHHQPQEALCTECRALLDYAMQRIDKCPLQADKPTCAKCPIHCYKALMKEQVKKVMKYSGPRMLRHHPVLAGRHLLDQALFKPNKKT